MFAKRKLFLGIVLALAGGCETSEEVPIFVAPTTPVQVAELTPILGEPMQPSAPVVPVEPEPVRAEASPAVAPASTRLRRPVRRRRSPAAPAFYPHGKPRPAAARQAEEPEERPRFILRGGPRWAGQRIGLGRVHSR